MDPLTAAVIGAIAVAVAIPIIVVSTLRFFKHVIAWFNQRVKLLLPGRRKAVGFIEKMRNGQCSYVQGVLDMDREKLVDYQRYKADELDREIVNAHGQNDLLVYQS